MKMAINLLLGLLWWAMLVRFCRTVLVLMEPCSDVLMQASNWTGAAIFAVLVVVFGSLAVAL